MIRSPRPARLRLAVVALAAVLPLVLAASPAAAGGSGVKLQQITASSGGNVVLVDVVPKSGPGVTEPVPAAPSVPASPALSPAAFTWVLQSQSTAVFTDLSMADATHGFASAELG